MLSISQSVKLWVCSIDQVVDLCYRSVCWSSCGIVPSVSQSDELWVCNIDQVVDLCYRSVCWSVPSNVPVLIPSETKKRQEEPGISVECKPKVSS